MSWQRRLSEFAARIGLSGLAIGLLAALLAAQTVRLEGLKIWPLSIEGARPKAERLAAALAAIEAAQRQAGEAQRSVNAAAEEKYRTIAREIDDEARGALDKEGAAAERHIADNRLRCPAAGSASGRAAAPAADHSAGNPPSAGGPAGLDGVTADLVAVTAQDVRLCTVNTIKAEAGHDLAIRLRDANVDSGGAVD